MTIVAGIDIGSKGTRCVCFDGKQVVGFSSVRTSPDIESTALNAIKETGVHGIDYIATTGMGRYGVPFRQIQITEITCATRAVRFAFKNATYVLDIGAQTTKAIRIGENGRVAEFRMNEKCAAGSGAFLERVAKYLEVPLEEIGTISLESKNPQPISSICAVLAESEIINHVSEGKEIPDIIRGVYNSLADRALLLLKRAGFTPAKNGPGSTIVMIGGVTLQEGMVVAAKEKFGTEVLVPSGLISKQFGGKDALYATAFGAALLAYRRAELTSKV